LPEGEPGGARCTESPEALFNNSAPTAAARVAPARSRYLTLSPALPRLAGAILLTKELASDTARVRPKARVTGLAPVRLSAAPW
jgi:hypothetical protein